MQDYSKIKLPKNLFDTEKDKSSKKHKKKDKKKHKKHDTPL